MKKSITLIAITGLALVALAGCDAPPGNASAAQPGMTPRAFIPSFSGNASSDPQCASQSAVVTIAPGAQSAQIGETITLTVILANNSCDTLGLPQYRLWAEPRDATPLFEIVGANNHSPLRSVAQQQTDSADFALRAVTAGEQGFGASVSYELHTAQGATWGLATASPITITVQGP